MKLHEKQHIEIILCLLNFPCQGLQLWFSDCFRYLLKFLLYILMTVHFSKTKCIFVLLLERSRTSMRQMDNYIEITAWLARLYDFYYALVVKDC